MTKTTGERIVEEWVKECSRTFTTQFQDQKNLSRRIDESLATAEGEVERLREALSRIANTKYGIGRSIAREALAKKEG